MTLFYVALALVSFAIDYASRCFFVFVLICSIVNFLEPKRNFDGTESI